MSDSSLFFTPRDGLCPVNGDHVFGPLDEEDPRCEACGLEYGQWIQELVTPAKGPDDCCA